MRLLPENVCQVRGKELYISLKGRSVRQRKHFFFSEILIGSWSVWISPVCFPDLLCVQEVKPYYVYFSCFHSSLANEIPCKVRGREQDTDVDSLTSFVGSHELLCPFTDHITLLPSLSLHRASLSWVQVQSTQPLRLTGRKDPTMSFGFLYTCHPFVNSLLLK